jgi:hypothetical protein
MRKTINIITEYFANKVESFVYRKTSPSLLAYGVATFTNEGWLDGVNRQGRVLEYLYYNA